MRVIIIGLLCLFSLRATSQEELVVIESGLKSELEAIYDMDGDDAKIKAAGEFLLNFRRSLYKQGAFDYDYESLPISKLVSPDKKLRIFTWNINLEYGKEKYFGLVMIPTKRGLVDVITLKDTDDEIKNLEMASLNNNKWYGALYIDIVPFKKNGKRYYALLGWDGYSMVLNRKIVDVMTVSGKSIRFGSPVFKKGKKTKKRLVFEYAEDAVMSLLYDKKKKRIVFHHISSMGNHIDGEKEFYAPDLTFDAYSFKRGKWYFQDNIKYLRPLTKKDAGFKNPRKK